MLLENAQMDNVSWKQNRARSSIIAAKTDYNCLSSVWEAEHFRLLHCQQVNATNNQAINIRQSLTGYYWKTFMYEDLTACKTGQTD